MTVEMFQEWHKIMCTERDILEREYKLLSLVSGISLSKLESMKRGEVKDLFAKMGKMQRQPMRGTINEVIAIGWKPYVCFTNLKDFESDVSTNQLTALKTWTQSEQASIENMHRCLALLYVPYIPFSKKKIPANIEKAAERFKKARVGQVYGTLFFYSKVSEKLQESFHNSSKQAMETITEHLKEVISARGQTSPKGTAGIT